MGPQPEAVLPFQSCEELEGSWGRLGSHLTQLLDSRTWLPPRGRTSTHSTPSPFSLLTDAVLGCPISGPWFLLLSQQISTSSLSQEVHSGSWIPGKAKEACKTLARTGHIPRPAGLSGIPALPRGLSLSLGPLEES